MAEELIYKVGVEGTNELNKLEQSVDKAGKSVGKTKLYMSELRTELRKARGDMIKYAEGTDEYNRALLKGSRITAQINAANTKMRAGVQDLGDTAKNVTGAMVGMAGGFQVVQSTMSLFGIENEETIKTVLKLQQTMSLVQGLSAFAQGIDNAQDILAAFRVNNKKVVGELQDTSKGLDGVSKSSDSMGDSFKASGKESAVLGSNLAGNTKIADDLNKGLGGLGDGLNTLNTQQLEQSKELIKSNLALLENTKKDIESKIKNATETDRLLAKTARWGSELDETNLKITEQNKKLSELDEQLTNTGKATGDLSKSQENVKKNSEGAGKGFTSFAKTIGKSLLTMGAFLIVIWAVTTAISALAKWLSKVPESVKIKIELEEDVQNQLAKERLEAKKYANDLQLIHRKVAREGKEADIERLKRIREQGKEEMGLTDIQLDNIATVQEDWMLMFDAYLLKAEYTYKKEALMKMKIDAETRIKLEKAAAKLKFDEVKDEDGELPFGWTYEGLEAQAKTTGVTKAVTESLLVWKDAQQIVDHIREATRIETKELATINKVIADLDEDLANVDFGTGVKETKGGPGDTTKSTKAPKFGLRKPDTVEEDLLTKQSEKVIKLREGFTNEEQAIMEEAQRKFDKRQDDSLIKYTEYQIKLGEAIAKDLKIKLEGKEKELLGMEILYDEELSIQNQALEEKTRVHNEELEYLRKLTQDKFDIEENANKLIEERASVDPKDSAKIKAIDAEIEALQRLYEANDADIAMSKDKISTAKEEIKSIEEKLQKLDLMPEQIKALGDEMDQLTLQIEENSARIVDAAAANMVAMMDMATTYVDSIGAAFQGIANMNADFMQAEDNKTAKEKNNLELSQAYREADSEQQQQMMYELELANYEAKKKTFETNKAFQIGAVITQSAANQMDIIKAWLDPKTGGPLSPANIAVAAAATAANVATTIGSVKQISSTSLEKPVPPGAGTGGSGGPGAGIALSPNKTSLTSKEENLNMMYQSGKDKNSENVVRVSDINKVQNKVSVREKNSSY